MKLTDMLQDISKDRITACSIPKSAASRNIDIALVSSMVALACKCFSWTIAAICCSVVAALAAVNALKCFLDVQEANMQFLNAMLAKLSRKDKHDNK